MTQGRSIKSISHHDSSNLPFSGSSIVLILLTLVSFHNRETWWLSNMWTRRGSTSPDKCCL